MNVKRAARLVLGPIIILATIGLFVRYLSQHAALLHQLGRTPASTVFWVLVLDACMLGTLALLLQSSLRLFGKSLGGRDNFLLNAYSSLVNFFGPGQSGPAVRAAYLKRQVGMRLKDYAFATLIYYGAFAAASALLVLAGTRPWWQTVLASGAFAGAAFYVLRYVGQKRDETGLQTRAVGGILAAAALQMAVQVTLYGVELHSVDRHVGLGQIVAYTGVANFALFVALTPGAIGIREAFLVFSEKLHHISSSAIVGANLIDRGVYLLFLGLLFVVVLGMHAKRRLYVHQSK